MADDDSKSRFIEVSKDDVDGFIAQKENENMKKKTMYMTQTLFQDIFARFGKKREN